jgi:hypothetical protein
MVYMSRTQAKIRRFNAALPIVPGQVNAVQDIPMDWNWCRLLDVRPAHLLRSRLVYRYANLTRPIQATAFLTLCARSRILPWHLPPESLPRIHLA